MYLFLPYISYAQIYISYTHIYISYSQFTNSYARFILSFVCALYTFFRMRASLFRMRRCISFALIYISIGEIFFYVICVYYNLLAICRATDKLKETARKIMASEPVLTRLRNFKAAFDLMVVTHKENNTKFEQPSWDKRLPPSCSKCHKDCVIGYFECMPEMLHCETCALANMKEKKPRDYRVVSLMDPGIVGNVIKFIDSL